MRPLTMAVFSKGLAMEAEFGSNQKLLQVVCYDANCKIFFAHISEMLSVRQKCILENFICNKRTKQKADRA